VRRAKEAAEQALELDPGLAAVHASLGLCHRLDQNSPAAIRELERAIELQPSYAEAHNWLSYFCFVVGRTEEALVHAERAVKLNPLSPEAVSHLALRYLIRGDHQQALAEARRALELSPEWSTGTLYQALVLYEMGRFDAVRALLEGIHVEWTGLGAEATLALAQIAAGDRHAAGEVSARIGRQVDPFAAGLVRLAQGEIDAAFERFSTLEKLTEWQGMAIHIFFGEIWDSVRDDPRYRELVRKAYRSFKLEPPVEASRE
jgi:tetratricopeptide (TPR) repeat protein